jgi:hypothetical protein
MVIGRANESTIYVNDAGVWTEVEAFEDFNIKLKQNQVSEFSIRLPDIQAAEKAYIKEYAEVVFLFGTTLILKGRIQKITYQTAYECDITGYGKEAILLDKEFIKAGDNRIQYTNESAQIIAEEALSSNSDGSAPWVMESDGLGLFTTDYGNISMRYEYANRLSSLAKLTESLNYEWSVTQSADFFTDFFQLAPLLPTTTRATVSQGTFSISGATPNCSQTSNEKDITNVANKINGLGYGDGINQVTTNTYNASDTFTTLGTSISDTDTTITLTDASAFASSGEIRIMEERITYSGKSSNDLTGCVRGTSSTDALEHKAGVFIEKYIAIDSAESGSSIDTNGLMDDTITNRDILDAATLELIVSRELLKRLDPIVRIKIIPDEPEETVETFKVGDLVTIEDEESDIDDDYRIVSINFASYYGDLQLELECSNRTLTFIEQMAKERKEAEALGKYMQGSTNIYAINEAENCGGELSSETQSETNIATAMGSARVNKRIAQKKTIENRVVTRLGFKLADFGDSPTGTITFAIRRVSDDGIIDSATMSATLLNFGSTFHYLDLTGGTNINEEVRLSCEYNGNDDVYVSSETNDEIAGEEYSVYTTSWSDDSAADLTYHIEYESSSFPLNLRFFIPEDAIAINKVRLNLKTEKYRADSKSVTSAPNSQTNTSIWHSSTLASITDLENPSFKSKIAQADIGIENTDGDVYYLGLDSSFNTSERVPLGSGPTAARYFAFTSGGWNSVSVLAADAFTQYTWPSPIFTQSKAEDLTGTFDKIRISFSVQNGTGASASPTILLRRSPDGSAWTTIATYTPTLDVAEIFQQQVEETTDFRDYVYKVEISNFNINNAADVSWIVLNVTTYMKSTDDLNYGIVEDTFPSGSPEVVIEVGEEGSESSVSGSPFSISDGGEEDIDITDQVSAVGAGNWVNVKFTPQSGTNHNRIRIEANVYIKLFINSDI